MCDSSRVNDLLGKGGVLASSSATSSTPFISAVRLRHSRDQFYVIDIRESEEIANDPLPSDMIADVEVPMGKLLAAGLAEDWINQKGIVLVCNSGHRASITARELANSRPESKVLALQQGLIGLRNPAATVPDTVIVLATKTSAEKLTLALNACAVAASNGETTVLGLMGDGVCTFLRKGNNKDVDASDEKSFRVEETFVGEPFKPCQALLTKFVSTGNGVVLACTSCIKSRGIEFGSDMLDCVEPMQMPDLMRMLGQAKTNLQFM